MGGIMSKDYGYCSEASGPYWCGNEKPDSLYFKVECSTYLFREAKTLERRQALAMRFLEEMEQALREQHARVNELRALHGQDYHKFNFPIEDATLRGEE
jgi:hypothetical protein